MTHHTVMKRYGCLECGVSFSKRSNLERHTESIHERLRDPHGYVATRPELTCNVCNFTFTRQESFRRHVRRGGCTHVEVENDLLCEMCGRVFCRVDNLRSHQRTCHQQGMCESN